MTTTDLVATIALIVSSLTLGWTIYRDAIQKPKFRVSIAIKTIFQHGHEPDGPYIFVDALNLGPLPNRVSMICIRKSWINRILHPDDSNAVITPDWRHWANTAAGTRLDVGDTAQFVIPFDRDAFLKENFIDIGVSDGYGRIHWAKRKQLRVAKKRYRMRFIEGRDDGLI